MTIPLLIAALAPVSLQSLPPAELPNTEVSTNMALSVNLARLEKFHFELQVLASPSNNYELAIGTDSNQDGHLSLTEADFTFGYDAGTAFFTDTARGTVVEHSSEQQPDGTVIIRHAFSKHEVRPEWNLIKLVRRGIGNQLECATSFEEHTKFTISVR